MQGGFSSLLNTSQHLGTTSFSQSGFLLKKLISFGSRQTSRYLKGDFVPGLHGVKVQQGWTLITIASPTFHSACNSCVTPNIREKKHGCHWSFCQSLHLDKLGITAWFIPNFGTYRQAVSYKDSKLDGWATCLKNPVSQEIVSKHQAGCFQAKPCSTLSKALSRKRTRNWPKPFTANRNTSCGVWHVSLERLLDQSGATMSVLDFGFWILGPQMWPNGGKELVSSIWEDCWNSKPTCPKPVVSLVA